MKGVKNMILKEKIQFLIDKGFTCGQIAKICNCHSSSISKWLNGTSQISSRMEESIENHIKSFLNELNNIWG